MLERMALVGFVILAFSGCVTEQDRGEELATLMRSLKQSETSTPQVDLKYQSTLGEMETWPVSLEVTDLPWSTAVRLLVQQADLNVILPALENDPLVTMDLTGTELGPSLRELGTLVDLQPTVEKGVVRFVPESSSNVAFLQPGYLPVGRAREVFTSALPDAGIEVAGQSLAVFGDSSQVARATAIADLLQMDRASTWLFTVHLLEVSKGAAASLGMDMDIGGVVSGVFSGGSSSIISDLLITGTITGDSSTRISRVLQSASVCLVEGSSGRLQSGSTVPIPRRTVSPYGVVQTTGYDYVDTGLIVDLATSRVTNGIRLDIKPQLSGVTGYVEDAPVVAQRAIEASTIVTDNDFIVLAGLDLVSSSVTKGLFEIANTESNEEVLIVVQANKGRRSILPGGMR